MSTTIHHKIGPSKLPALAACPCYVSDPKGSAAAEKGSDLHEIFEHSVKGTLREKAEKDQRFRLLLQSFKDSDLAGIQWATESVRETIAISLSVPTAEIDLAALVKAGTLRVEEKVSVIDENFEEVNFGTLDLWFSVPGVAILWDLKTGRRRNYREQMANYCLAKFQEDPTISRIRSILLFSAERKIDEDEFDLETAESVFWSAIRGATAADRKANPCDYCSWCLSRPTCPALLSGVDLVRMDRPDLFPEGEAFRSSETLKKAIAALEVFQNAATDPIDEELLKEATSELSQYSEALSYLLRTAKVAAKYLEGVENSVKEAIRLGIPVPGYKLQKKSGAVEVSDIQGLYNLLKISPDLFLSACKVSTEKLVEAVPAEKIEALVLDSGIKIPNDFRKKSGSGILKASLKKAFDMFLESTGVLQRGADSFSVVAEKKKEVSK